MTKQLKFYVHFEGQPEHTFKATFDDNLSFQSVIDGFVKDYNKKHGNQRTLDGLNLAIKKQGVVVSAEAPIGSLLKEGDDVYVIEEEKELVCGRFGCKKKYFEKDNVDNCCQFHPGPPIFHEGYKGWKCCNRKTVDFNEFEAIEGCAWGKHFPEVEKQKPTFAKITNVNTSNANPGNLKVTSQGGVEVYQSSEGAAAAPPAKKPLPKPDEVAEEPAPPPKYTEIPDPPDAVIAVNAPCTHQGCKATFKDDSSRTEECYYHPGRPIFHEGSKGWDCCRKLTLLFDEFWNQEGCTKGVHKFIPDEKPKVVSVRHDFYQMGENIVLTLYAKNCDKSSTVNFTPSSFFVNLKLPNGDVFQNEFKLTGGKRLNEESAKYTVMSTKVEIKFKKATEGDWTKL